MSVAETIHQKLTAALKPSRLEIVDDSARHAGHSGAGHGAAAGESHFKITVVSQAFDGKSRIERHMLVNEALADELRGPVHMLQIKAITPAEEWQ
ncbi:BolA family protein [Pyruvatibacter sp.]|uniref:BolA family protein n=1 Tax=Pyruvatibacter sp. TaxID=1981328 RepID=UPI0032ECB48D